MVWHVAKSKSTCIHIAHRLGSICVAHYFPFAEISIGSVPQTFVHVGSTEAETIQQDIQLW